MKQAGKQKPPLGSNSTSTLGTAGGTTYGVTRMKYLVLAGGFDATRQNLPLEGFRDLTEGFP